MNSSVRSVVLWVIILCLVGLAWVVIHSNAKNGDQPAFSELYQKVKGGEVTDVLINSATGDISGHYRSKDDFHSTIPPNFNDFTTLLIDKNVTIKYEKDGSSGWVSI